jgi:uncharacterized protein YndB with AHSA1/START domain
MMTELILTNWYRAGPAKLWGYWTEAEKMALWFAPAGARVLAARARAELGGDWVVVFSQPDGGSVTEQGHYLDLQPHGALRMSLQQHFDDGRSGPVTEVSVALTPEGNGTRLDFRQTGIDPDQADGMRAGWQSCLDQIADAVAQEIGGQVHKTA